MWGGIGRGKGYKLFQMDLYAVLLFVLFFFLGGGGGGVRGSLSFA